MSYIERKGKLWHKQRNIPDTLNSFVKDKSVNA